MIKPIPKTAKAFRPSHKTLMKLWQEVVKKRAGYRCEYPDCRKSEYLNAHHVFSRSRYSVRYDPDNGMCLCSGHHSLNNDSAHKDPFFIQKIMASGVRTEAQMHILRRRAYTPAKLDLNAIKLDLENCLKNS